MNRLKKTFFFILPLVLFLNSGLILQAAQQQGKRVPPSFFNYLLRPKFVVMLIIGLTALFFLLSKKMKKSVKIPILLISTFLFGIIGNLGIKIFSSFSMHPSPICAATKSILYGFRIPMIVTLVVITFLTLIGPKLFCGWVCPVGALQELIAMAADKMKIKRIKWNFTFSNTVRIGLFLLFIFLSGTAIIQVTANERIVPVSLYDYINAFHGFEFVIAKTFFENVIHYLPFLLTVILAFKLYRPFCHLVCPIGIYAHLLEQISFFRISLKKKACTDCTVCTKMSPCAAVPDILKDTTLRPDCYSCNICVESCPENALEYGTKKTISEA